MNKQKLIELRCKAWGITEDEYYCKQCSDFSLEDMAKTYRRGKNKGARDKAIQNVGFYQKQIQDIYDKKNKQITKLEETIKRLQKQLLEFTRELHKSNKFCYSCANATERCFTNEIGCPCEKYKSYKEENAELKEAVKHFNPCGEWNDDVHDCEFRHYAIEYGSKLTKAKEIIEKVAKMYRYSPRVEEIIAEAERFLKEE